MDQVVVDSTREVDTSVEIELWRYKETSTTDSWDMEPEIGKLSTFGTRAITGKAMAFSQRILWNT